MPWLDKPIDYIVLLLALVALGLILSHFCHDAHTDSSSYADSSSYDQLISLPPPVVAPTNPRLGPNASLPEILNFLAQHPQVDQLTPAQEIIVNSPPSSICYKAITMQGTPPTATYRVQSGYFCNNQFSYVISYDDAVGWHFSVTQ